MTDYNNFINFLNDNVQSDNELDIIIYNIGAVQRISEQFSYFFNQKIEQQSKDECDIVDLEIQFEVECNEKISLALGIGDPSTLFIECECKDITESNIFIINVNKELIAKLTLEAMRNEI